MRNSRFYKLTILVLTEIVSQVGLVLVTDHFNTYSLTLNVLVGIILAIVFMAYWDNTREYRLNNLEIKVDESTKESIEKIQRLSNEINLTKRELHDLEIRINRIDERR